MPQPRRQAEVQAEVQAWSAGLLSIFRLKLKVLGSLSTPPQSVLVVFNHVSWLKCPLIAPLSSPLARRDEESDILGYDDEKQRRHRV